MNNKLQWVLRIVVAFILIQTLYFKFTAHPDSVFIFEQTGLGAPGRIGTGVMELIAAILILNPKTIWLGAGLTLGIISGAVLFHLTKLGIHVNGDGGTLFYMALTVLILSAILLFDQRNKIYIPGVLDLRN